MKSKLTLRLDDDLKERAKRLADERGISVSKLVEDYFHLLLRKQAGGDGRPTGVSTGTESSGKQSGSGEEFPGEALSPRIQALRENLGKPVPEVDLDDDTRRWVEAAAEKHQ